LIEITSFLENLDDPKQVSRRPGFYIKGLASQTGVTHTGTPAQALEGALLFRPSIRSSVPTLPILEYGR
jgi:hypothetical protein